ncbi:MAG: 30S ribosomal protein S13 [Candidatus Altarchaeaceae archaeon]
MAEKDKGSNKGDEEKSKGEKVKRGDEQKTETKIKKKVRFLNYVLDGDKKVKNALINIKGIGIRMGTILSTTLKIGDKKLGDLTEEEIAKLENYVKNLPNYVPAWMLNHRNDQFTGQNLHYVGSDLDIAVKQDIDFMKKIKCYKGIRHEIGQPVRGQRTRTSFRKGGTVGVVKKKQQPAKAEEKKSK